MAGTRIAGAAGGDTPTRLVASFRRARRGAVVAAVGGPALGLWAVFEPPGNRQGGWIAAGAVAVGAVALAGTQLAWWWCARRLRAATGVAGAPPWSPRPRATADFRRASAFVVCDLAWLAVLVSTAAAAPRIAGDVPWPAAAGAWYTSVTGAVAAALALVPLSAAWLKAAAAVAYHRSRGPATLSPVQPAGPAADYAELAVRTGRAVEARRVAVRMMVVSYVLLLTLATLGAGVWRLDGNGETRVLAVFGAYGVFGSLAALAAAHARWWVRDRAARAWEDRLVLRTPRQHAWSSVRRLAAASAAAAAWTGLFNPTGSIVSALGAAERTGLARAVLSVALPVTMVAVLAALLLFAVTLAALATAVTVRSGDRVPRPRRPPPPPEHAGLERVRDSRRFARRIAIGSLLGSLAALVAVGSLVMPLPEMLPGFGLGERLLDTGPAVYVLSFVAWPLLIGSHYAWWRRSRAVLAAERRASAAARRRGDQMRRFGVGLLVAFGWFQVFYVGPSLAAWYRETGGSETADSLLRTYAPLPLYGLVFLLSFWVEPLIERGRVALHQFANQTTKGTASWRAALPWVSRGAWAMLALTFLPLYLENWGLWYPPRPLFTAMLVVEGVVLVIALAAGWWYDRRPREGDPNRRA